LSKLDVVLIMEDLTDHLAQLRAVFGWDVDVDRSVWHSHWHRIPKNVPWFKDNLMMEFNGGLTGFKGDSMGLSRDI